MHAHKTVLNTFSTSFNYSKQVWWCIRISSLLAMADLLCTSYIFFNLFLEHCRFVLRASSQQWLYLWRTKGKKSLCSPVLWTVRTVGSWMGAASAPQKEFASFVFLSCPSGHNQGCGYWLNQSNCSLPMVLSAITCTLRVTGLGDGFHVVHLVDISCPLQYPLLFC